MPRWFFAIYLLAGVALCGIAANAEENGFNNLLQGIIGSDGKDAAAAPVTNTNPDNDLTSDVGKDSTNTAPNFTPMPFAVLRTLDKVTARAKTIQVQVDAPFKVGNLLAVVKVCRQRPPEEPPESAAFLQIVEEKTSEHQVKNLFSGWMFASSPGLSALEHPIYDIWLVKCAAPAPKPVVTEDKPATTTAPVKPAKSDSKNSKAAAKAPAKAAGKSP